MQFRPPLRQLDRRGWRGSLAARRRADRREDSETGDERGDPHVS